MTTNKTKSSVSKSRNFAFILYPENLLIDWIEKLEKLGLPIAISPLHDKDVTERKASEMTVEELKVIEDGGLVYKKPHYHVMYIANNPVSVESVRKKIKRCLGDKTISHIEIVDNVANYYQYLTHESSDAVKKGKHRYDSRGVVRLNDFDIDRYVVLTEVQKKELGKRVLELIDAKDIVNVKELYAFVKIKGSEFDLPDVHVVMDVIKANSGFYSMYFDANYNSGFRGQYARRIDVETGEVKESILLQNESEKKELREKLSPDVIKDCVADIVARAEQTNREIEGR